MKKYLMLLAVFILSLYLIFSGCKNSNNKDEDTVNQEEKAEQTPKKEVEKEATEDPQIAIDNQKAIECLNILGLDETCSYELRDTFPIDGTEEKSYLLNVSNILEDDFKSIQTALENRGFNIVSDITEDEERKARSFQYSNSSDLYIEIVFSYGMSYFDVIFTPIIS